MNIKMKIVKEIDEQFRKINRPRMILNTAGGKTRTIKSESEENEDGWEEV